MPPLWPSVHEWTTLVFEAALANEIISFRYFCGCPRKIYISYLCNHLALRNKEGKLNAFLLAEFILSFAYNVCVDGIS